MKRIGEEEKRGMQSMLYHKRTRVTGNYIIIIIISYNATPTGKQQATYQRTLAGKTGKEKKKSNRKNLITNYV